MKRKLKIADFNRGTLLVNHHIFRLLAQEYDVEFSDAPELLLFAEYPESRNKSLDYDCHKIFLSGENIKPDFGICDYAFSIGDTDEKNFQFLNFTKFPYFRHLNPCEHQNSFSDRYALHPSFSELEKYKKADKLKFCCFIYSNHSAKERIEFCKKLMFYKKVDCPGKVLNNMPSFDKPGKYKGYTAHRDRFAFTKQYKFTIAFENCSAINYTSEKICVPFMVGSIPIYWGNPRVSEYFNPEAFINCHDYDNFDQVIKHVIEVDNNNDLYQKYVKAPPILRSSKLCAITEEKIMERLDKIVDSIGVTTPVSRKLSYKFRSLWYRSRWFQKVHRLNINARSYKWSGRQP